MRKVRRSQEGHGDEDVDRGLIWEKNEGFEENYRICVRWRMQRDDVKKRRGSKREMVCNKY